jgi:hypothetical protein
MGRCVSGRYRSCEDALNYAQCTPQELAVLLQAFNKIATAYHLFESPSDVGFKSKILNDILFSLPKLKDPIKGFLGDISLKKASEGRLDTMWTDPEKYPSIADIDLVCISSVISHRILNRVREGHTNRRSRTSRRAQAQ